MLKCNKCWKYISTKYYENCACIKFWCWFVCVFKYVFHILYQYISYLILFFNIRILQNEFHLFFPMSIYGASSSKDASSSSSSYTSKAEVMAINNSASSVKGTSSSSGKGTSSSSGKGTSSSSVNGTYSSVNPRWRIPYLWKNKHCLWNYNREIH